MIDSISERSTFAAFRRPDARAHAGSVRIDHLRAEPLGQESEDSTSSAAEFRAVVRVAYAISSHIGGAVTRNRLRRQFRSIVTELDADGAMRPGAYLIVAKKSAPEHSFASLAEDVRRALRKLDQKLGPSISPPSGRREQVST